MFRKTLTAAIAVAAISGSALLATSTASQAGYYGGGGYGYHGGYSYAPSCFYKKVKVHGYYGWSWKRVRVCH